MMTLLQLVNKAREAFPGKDLTAAHVLFVWADAEEEVLDRILSPAQLEIPAFKEALRPFLDDPKEEDKELMLRCIRGVPGTSPTGWHLLKALCDEPQHRITRALVKAGMNLEGLQKGLDAKVPKDPVIVMQNNLGKRSELLKYGRDLTQEAADGAFDDLCPRPDELRKLIQILLRKERPNPVLTGPAGVGKTALVELLAREVVRGQVPEKLAGIRIFEVSMGKLVAGTIYRGQLEARFEEVMNELRRLAPAILFIDEFHLVWGAGRAEGAPMDVANLLKPLLNQGTIRVIGATTSEEYHRYIEQDAALARRFTELPLKEPAGETLLQILKEKCKALEEHHGIKIPASMLSRAVELTDFHLPNRHQPAKAIDLLDQAAVKAAAAGHLQLTEEDLLQGLEDMTGRPITKPGEEELCRLLEAKERLKQRVIGQDEAIDRVIATLIYRRQHLGKEEKNLGSFLFLGNTGVGKTELARALAVELFGSEEHLLRLDMAEYKGVDAVQKLVGFSLPFPGAAEGVFTRWLYSHGTGVILFDEIEKADAPVKELLLGLLDRGRIRDARGQELDTRQCIIVLTSNALHPEALRRKPVGFGAHEDSLEVADLLRKDFPREFLGRLDEIILFRDLGDAELKRILKLNLEKGLERFRKNGVRVEYKEDQLLDYLLQGLKQAKEAGARGVERLLEKQFFQPLALAVARAPGCTAFRVRFGKGGKMNILPKGVSHSGGGEKSAAGG